MPLCCVFALNIMHKTTNIVYRLLLAVVEKITAAISRPLRIGRIGSPKVLESQGAIQTNFYSLWI